ncbi:glycosyltransferase family 4 protein [Cellulomonas sp. ACRRI]|uniref:exopolysaccharide biosynthesis GT4 family glycosyltransferase EpsE n=1 Tax=Cellulomonas sp. ACRRI TaxID=2918188 RepID=UPI001EF25DF0|nr:exopolysaccharide biosynthesis GT4 family glycosyltransferase EpsE [Cellulomonas sp. ACRRI]MCG7288065.1 glycosyltransferase family 4 protein [Cellulomonas sp. ACRRI]
MTARRRRTGAPPAAPGGVVLGYLVPEFPGQTHAFFWREVAELERAGARPVLVSTRRPRRPAAHPWAREAAERTTYLADPAPEAAAGVAAVLARAVTTGRWRAVLRETRAAAAAGAAGAAGAAPGTGARTAGSRRVPVRLRAAARAAGLTLAAARLAGLAVAGGWQHLHVHSCGDAAQVAALARLLGGPPYSLTLHGPLADYGGNQRGKWRGAAFALAITAGLRREVRAALGPDAPAVVALAPMGVDDVAFTRALPYRPWPGAGPLRLVACGRLNPAKGHDDLLRAVRRLADRGLDARLVVLGEDERGGAGHRRDLEALVGALGLADRVRLPGAVGEDRVRAELGAAHVFALASHAEPLGVAVMEALAMALPVVVCAGGGVGELVADGRTGLLVPPRDPEALAAAVARLAADPALATALGAAGREHVAAGYASGRGARTLLDLVGPATGAAPARTGAAPAGTGPAPARTGPAPAARPAVGGPR